MLAFEMVYYLFSFGDWNSYNTGLDSREIDDSYLYTLNNNSNRGISH
jgi:hypothetical protein